MHGFEIIRHEQEGGAPGVVFGLTAGHLTSVGLLYENVIPALQKHGLVIVGEWPTDDSADFSRMAELFAEAIPADCTRLVLIGGSMGGNFFHYIADELERRGRIHLLKAGGIIADDSPAAGAFKGPLGLRHIWYWPKWVNKVVAWVVFNTAYRSFRPVPGTETHLKRHLAHIFKVSNRTRRREMAILASLPVIPWGKYRTIPLVYLAGGLDPFVNKVPAVLAWGKAHGLLEESFTADKVQLYAIDFVIYDGQAGHDSYVEQPGRRGRMLSDALVALGILNEEEQL
jgi:hypothetical protein